MNFTRDIRNQYILSGGADGDGATVHKAKHVNLASGEKFPVGIKIFDAHKIEDIDSFTAQLHEAESFDHENIVKVHCSFKTGDQIWVVMSPPGIPIRKIIRRRGMPENDVAFILKEALKVLHYMHDVKNTACENFGAGCVSLDDEGRVKIGISSITQNTSRGGGDEEEVKQAELVANYGRGKLDKATDTSMLGLLALELFYGNNFLTSDEFTLLVADDFKEKREKLWRLKMLEKFRVLSCFPHTERRRRRMPAALAEVVVACLCRDAEARPTANQLMEFRLFRKRFHGILSYTKLVKKLIKNK